MKGETGVIDLVEFLDSAVLVIEFMAPPTIQKVKDGAGIYLLWSLLIVVPWYSGCKILIGTSIVIPCFCNGLSYLKSRKINKLLEPKVCLSILGRSQEAAFRRFGATAIFHHITRFQFFTMPPWDRFRELCLLRFGPPIRGSRLAALGRLPFTSTVQDYADRFQALACHAPGISGTSTPSR